jgi:hypothetical protein
MTLNSIFVATGLASFALVHSAAYAGPAPDLDYPQVMALLAETQGSPAQVRPKLVGKMVSAALLASRDSLWIVSHEDGVYFKCAASASGFKGGPVVAKVMQYDAVDNGEGQEPLLVLENCAN